MVQHIFFDNAKIKTYNGIITLLSILPIFCWSNLFMIKSNAELTSKILKFILKFLSTNPQPEIRQVAADTLRSLTTATIFDAESILKHLKSLHIINSKKLEKALLGKRDEMDCSDDENVENIPPKKRLKSDSGELVTKPGSPITSKNPLLYELHGIVLGFCAVIESSPYHVPVWLPDLIVYLNPFAYSKYANIKSTCKKSIF